MSKKVSVIMGIYNCANTLEEALENGYRPCKRCKPDIIEISGRE